MIADIFGVCFFFFFLFSSDQIKTSNLNTERVNYTSQQSKSNLEGKIFI